MEEKHDLGSCKCSTKIRGLTVRKHNGVILHDVNLDVEHGEILALIGRNGAGKRGGSQVFPRRRRLCWICSDGRKKWRDR